MKSITIDHIAVMVGDLDKSLHFYRDLLGFEVVASDEHADSPAVDMMTGMSGVHLREYRLGAPGGVNGYERTEGPAQLTFDLIQWTKPASPTGRVPINHVPSSHICLGVEDLSSTYERLKGEGVQFVSPPVTFTGEGEWHVLFLYDPDGNLLEFNEIGAGKQQAHKFEWTKTQSS
jgi:catechol 2,3-dioxygenase-like lactoylglutathione lyase family enzyme